MFNNLDTQSVKKILMVLALCAVSTGNAVAGNTQEFRWLMGKSDPNVTGIALCEMGSCPTEAAASSGERLVLTGVGTLSTRSNGKPKSINGGGHFSLHDKDDNLVSYGHWKARRLLMFDNYDGSDLAPANFRAGRMLAVILLKPDNGKAIRAVVELGCRIPGNSGIPGTIEGVRVYLDDGSGFVFPFDPRSTLFVDLNS